jgi:hypothetical protein
MKPCPNRTNHVHGIRLSHLTRTFSWSIGATVHVPVTLMAEGLSRVARCAVRPDPCQACLAAQCDGMVHVCDGLFSAALTGPFGPLQCCRARGKAASTLPVQGNDGFSIHRPWSWGGQRPDWTRSWWEEVQGHGLSTHEDAAGVPSPTILGDRSSPSSLPFWLTHRR